MVLGLCEVLVILQIPGTFKAIASVSVWVEPGSLRAEQDFRLLLPTLVGKNP